MMQNVMKVVERALGELVENLRGELPPGVQVAGKSEYDSLGFVTVTVRVIDVDAAGGERFELGVVGLYGQWDDIVGSEASWEALGRAVQQVVACWQLTNLQSALFVEVMLG